MEKPETWKPQRYRPNQTNQNRTKQLSLSSQRTGKGELRFLSLAAVETNASPPSWGGARGGLVKNQGFHGCVVITKSPPTVSAGYAGNTNETLCLSQARWGQWKFRVARTPIHTQPCLTLNEWVSVKPGLPPPFSRNEAVPSPLTSAVSETTCWLRVSWQNIRMSRFKQKSLVRQRTRKISTWINGHQNQDDRDVRLL